MIKAALLTATHEIRLVDNFALPEPDPDEIVIDVKASGICGSDVHVYNGRVDDSDFAVSDGT